VFSAKPGLRLLLDRFSRVLDTWQAWKGRVSTSRGSVSVVCATIVNCDEHDDIVDLGEPLFRFCGLCRVPPRHSLLRPAAHGDQPDRSRPVQSLFFSSRVAECWPAKLDLVAIDGKTWRRSHNRKTRSESGIWYQRSPPTAGWCWGSRRSSKNRMRPLPFQRLWSVSIFPHLCGTDIDARRFTSFVGGGWQLTLEFNLFGTPSPGGRAAAGPRRSGKITMVRIR
jgi:hypothetical protein